MNKNENKEKENMEEKTDEAMAEEDMSPEKKAIIVNDYFRNATTFHTMEMDKDEMRFKEVRKNHDNDRMFIDDKEDDITPKDTVFCVDLKAIESHVMAASCTTIALNLKAPDKEGLQYVSDMTF
jgi:hypothetical protein